MKDPGLLPFNKNNTRVEIESLGEVELKYISWRDATDISKLPSDNFSDKEFVVYVLFQQLVKPDIDFERFNSLADSDIHILAQQFMEKNQSEFEIKVVEGDLYSQFRKSYLASESKRFEDLRKSIEPAIRVISNEFKSFQNNYSALTQQVIGGNSFVSESIKKIAQVEKLINEDIRIALPITLDIDQFRTTAEIIGKSLSPQIDFWRSWVAHNRDLSRKLQSFWTALPEFTKFTDKKAAAILRKYKWFVTPNMPVALTIRIVELDQKKGRQDREVNRIFVEYFEAKNWKNLELMVRGWEKNSLLKKRSKILLDCVEAIKASHKSSVNAANVVLPTLITQIDGALSDYLTRNSIQWKCDYDDRYDKKKKRVTGVGRKSQFKSKRPKVLTTDLDDLANDIFLNILFQRSQRGKPLKTPFNFNRHKIIHGESTRYGRRDYMIRAFLVLDMLSSL